jgi:AcrR family transcriptional regulator
LLDAVKPARNFFYDETMSTDAEPSPAPQRRSHAERSAHTKGLLLDATIEALIEVGYNDLTTTDVVRRAGLSRGAQVHHYPRKVDLVQAAIEHLNRKVRAELLSAVDGLPPEMDRVDTALTVLWSTYDRPTFWANMELTVAGRTDPALQPALASLERETSTTLYEFCRDLFGQDDNPAIREAVELSIYFMTGLAIAALQKDPSWTEPRLDTWRHIVRQVFEQAEAQ